MANSAFKYNELNGSCAVVADCFGGAAEFVQTLCGKLTSCRAPAGKRVFAIKPHWANRRAVNVVPCAYFRVVAGHGAWAR